MIQELLFIFIFLQTFLTIIVKKSTTFKHNVPTPSADIQSLIHGICLICTRFDICYNRKQAVLSSSSFRYIRQIMPLLKVLIKSRYTNVCIIIIIIVTVPAVLLHWGISTHKLEHSDLLYSNSLHQFAMSLVHQPRQSALPEQSAQFT